jgi:LDH2 family malate/lactate/ureidoglycolate dehydrogenase
VEKARCFQASYLHAITRRLLMAAGTLRHIADVVAEVLVNANLTGHDSHGVLRVPHYLSDISKGIIHPAAEPKVVKETGNTIFFDGQWGFGHYTVRKAMKLAIEKARETDVCCVCFVRTGHIGRLGEYAEIAAQSGCIGIITYGTGERVGKKTVPFGGARGMLGTNPIAVGVPTGDDVPFIIDFATTMIAGGKIMVAKSKNTDLPQGCIIDKHGNPSVKTKDYYDGGFLLPFGGHKGYALSLLTCLLGGLSEGFNYERGAMGSVFMQIFNPHTFTPLETYQQHVRGFLDNIKKTPPARGFDEVLVPGDFEHSSRVERLVHGVEVPGTIYRQIQEWAEKLDISLYNDEVEAVDAARYQVP